MNVYLDTHIVLWLHDRLLDRLSPVAIEAIETHPVFISALVELELQYLHEIGRIRPKAHAVIRALSNSIGLKVSDIPLSETVRFACPLTWTRDPFDRLIVGETMAAKGKLITKDKLILEHYSQALC